MDNLFWLDPGSPRKRGTKEYHEERISIFYTLKIFLTNLQMQYRILSYCVDRAYSSSFLSLDAKIVEQVFRNFFGLLQSLDIPPTPPSLCAIILNINQ